MNPTLSPHDATSGGATGTAETELEQQIPPEQQGASDALDDASGGASSESGAAATAGGAGSPVAGSGDDAPTASASSGTSISKEDIEAILARVIPAATTVTQQSQVQTQSQPTYTQEQYDQMFNVYKPSADLLLRLRSEDPNVAIKALTEMQQGIIKQAMTMAEYRMQQYRDAVVKSQSEALTPIQAYVQEQRAAKWESDFYTKYPDLQEYSTIVEAVASKLQKEGWQGKDQADVMARFATDSQAVVQSLLAKAGQAAGAVAAGNGGALAKGKTIVAFPATTKRMSTLSGGGQGGTSKPGATAAAAKGPAGIEVFD